MSRHGAPGRGLASPEPPWEAVAGALLAAVSVLVTFQLVWTASVEAPLLDDFDAVLGFLIQWLDAEGWHARWRVFFRPHNEHVLGVPHAWVLLTHGLTGRLDLRLLNMIGNGYSLLLLGALYAAFRRGAPAGQRLAGFAPAALFVFQPQHSTALLSPTISLSNAGVVAWAAVALVAAERPGRGAAALAAGAALCATLSQANGVLVWPLLPLVPLLCGRRRAALAWALAAGALLAVFFLGVEAGHGRASPLASLGHPERIALYALHFLGCAPGFSRSAPALATGAVLLASFALLVARGLPRRSPVLFAVFLFLLGSILANALVRAHQGAGAPLLQPRYAFYSAVALALTVLAWGELLGDAAAARRWRRAALLTGLGFCLASHLVARPDVVALSQRLSDGLERWWSTGEGGLTHPDFRKASFFMLKGLDHGLIRLPDGWLERYAAAPQRRQLPPAGPTVRQRLHALHQDRDVLILSGWAFAGSSALEQEVEVVLASPDGVLFYPALEVVRTDLPQSSPRTAGLLAPSGFRVLIPTRDLEAGDYRLGILVRRGRTEHLTWRSQPLVIAGTPP